MARLGRLGNRPLHVPPREALCWRVPCERRAMPRPLLAAAVLAALIAPHAQAQGPERRPGVEREAVVQLAYALGEAHALRRLCAGPSDATWYARMERLEAAEGDNAAGRRQL